MKGWIMKLLIYNIIIIKIGPDKGFLYSKKYRSTNDALKFAYETYEFIYFTKLH